jgi:hypothetical protein
MKFLVFPSISLGSAVWWIGGFAIVPLFTILAGALFWTTAAIGLVVLRMVRRGRKRKRSRETDVRSRVESLP